MESKAMGYTTKFKGEFEISDVPSAEVIIRLRELEGCDGREDKMLGQPDSYNQWILTKDCRHIKWDGGEKFYNYVEWLQFLISAVLTPAKLTLSGSVQYSGEETDDVGVLAIVDGKVVKKQLELVSDDMAELIRFKKFVLASDYKDEILDGWRRINPR